MTSHASWALGLTSKYSPQTLEVIPQSSFNSFLCFYMLLGLIKFYCFTRPTQSSWRKCRESAVPQSSVLKLKIYESKPCTMLLLNIWYTRVAFNSKSCMPRELKACNTNTWPNLVTLIHQFTWSIQDSGSSYFVLGRWGRVANKHTTTASSNKGQTQFFLSPRQCTQYSNTHGHPWGIAISKLHNTLT